MRSLIIDTDASRAERIRTLIAAAYPSEIRVVSNMQEGIEHLEAAQPAADLVVCVYSGNSHALLRCALELSRPAPFVLLSEQRRELKDLLPTGVGGFTWISLKHWERDLEETLGALRTHRTPDSDYLKFDSHVLEGAAPIQADVFIKLAANRYVKVFRKADAISAEELRASLRKNKVEAFFVRREDADEVPQKTAKALDALLENKKAKVEAMRAQSEDALEVVQNIVSALGFTPAVQEVTKKTAHLVLKMIGDNPRLGEIAKRLQQNEGKYIASHSIMLAEIACTLAHQVGWSSAATYLKLSLAAMLHDVTLQDNALARVRKLEGIQGISPSDLDLIKAHPVKAAEYATQFHEVPPDVDHIVSQHHERPDGTGFPRKLFHSHIQPLSCLFIIAHDLLDYFLEHGASASVDAFLKENQEIYSVGNFKKIAAALAKNSAAG